jgi:hypothetical protein
LYSDAALRARLVAKGKLQRAQFSWDKAAEQLYQQLQAQAKG